MDLGLSAPTYPSAKNVMLSDSSKHRASLKTKSSQLCYQPKRQLLFFHTIRRRTMQTIGKF
jgi:hypothetical protein